MRSRLAICRFLMVIVAVMAAVSGCSTMYNPATGRNETIFINTAQEIAMGNDMDATLQKKIKVLDNTAMHNRLNSIGHRIASVSDRQDLQYTFRIADDKEFNAFAVPGGYIYINSGLMDAANDDELACVVAHEIGHVAARHSVKQLQSTLGYSMLMNIALGLSGQAEIGKAADVIFNLTSLGYSRQDELQADLLAVRYARKAGYNPAGLISFFRILQEAQRKNPSMRVEFLSSHPDLAKRILRAQEEIAALP
jgi:beta-barrel assembly-enhancing protease